MKVIVIGGGIAGLTLAHALQRSGMGCEVYEAAPRLEVVGAGIIMAANAMQVFEKLGLSTAVAQQGNPLTNMVISDQSMRQLQNIDLEIIRQKYGHSGVAIHRGKLQQVLLAGLNPQTVFTAKRITGLVQENQAVTAHFEDGTSASGDLLVGADGIHSAVREAIFPASTYRYSGQTCWRGVAPIDQEQTLRNRCVEAWGKQARFGMVDIGQGQVYWFAVVNAPEGGKDETASLKADLLRRFDGFQEPVKSLINDTEQASVYRSDIRDLKRLDAWSKGRVCLIGDAGHATTPNMGQGGCQAIEDAWFLTQALEQNPNPEDAFRKFELQRRRKVDLVVNQSWMIGKIAHIPFGRGLRNALLRATPPSVSAKSFESIYQLA